MNYGEAKEFLNKPFDKYNIDTQAIRAILEHLVIRCDDLLVRIEKLELKKGKAK